MAYTLLSMTREEHESALMETSEGGKTWLCWLEWYHDWPPPANLGERPNVCEEALIPSDLEFGATSAIQARVILELGPDCGAGIGSYVDLYAYDEEAEES